MSTLIGEDVFHSKECAYGFMHSHTNNTQYMRVDVHFSLRAFWLSNTMCLLKQHLLYPEPSCISWVFSSYTVQLVIEFEGVSSFVK